MRKNNNFKLYRVLNDDMNDLEEIVNEDLSDEIREMIENAQDILGWESVTYFLDKNGRCIGICDGLLDNPTLSYE